MIKRKTNLHVRRITAMLFFNPLKYLITAAKDGSSMADTPTFVILARKSLIKHLAVYELNYTKKIAKKPFGPQVLCSAQSCVYTGAQYYVIKSILHQTFLQTKLLILYYVDRPPFEKLKNKIEQFFD